MLNDPRPLPMDPMVDATWAVPSADARAEPDVATRAAPVGAALVAALRGAAGSTASRVTVGGAESPFAFVVGGGRIAPDGASVEPPLDQLAAALALDSAAVSVAPDPSADTAEALADASIDLEIALAQAVPLVAAWGEIMRIVPDDRAGVGLSAHLPVGGADVDDEQWRVIACIGHGRSVGELASRLEVGHLAAMRTVHDLAVLGLVDVTAAPKLLPAPPAAPLAAPAPTPVAGTAPLAPPAFAPPGTAPAVGLAPPPFPPLAAPAPVAEPSLAEPALAGPADDGWTTVATESDGDWSYERLAPDTDDWSEAPATPVSSGWDDTPVAAPPVDDWGTADSFDTTPTADLWADVPAEPPATTPPVRTSPTPAPSAEPVAPLVPARAVTPLPAYQRDEMPALPAEPAPAAATDEVLGSVVGEDELVNRALLFKFLSSMRD